SVTGVQTCALPISVRMRQHTYADNGCRRDYPARHGYEFEDPCQDSQSYSMGESQDQKRYGDIAKREYGENYLGPDVMLHHRIQIGRQCVKRVVIFVRRNQADYLVDHALSLA